MFEGSLEFALSGSVKKEDGERGTLDTCVLLGLREG